MTPVASRPTLFAWALCLTLLAMTTAPVEAQEGSPFTIDGPRACMPRYDEAGELVSVGLDVLGRPQSMQPVAAAAWQAMQHAARAEGVTLLLVSAFRSVEQQQRIFERKLRAGDTLDAILAVNVPPGYSQHHTGMAVDLGTPGNTALLEDFERTPAFRWLAARAYAFGFSLSYPRGNASGLSYEPWHWAFGPPDAARGLCIPAAAQAGPLTVSRAR